MSEKVVSVARVEVNGPTAGDLKIIMSDGAELDGETICEASFNPVSQGNLNLVTLTLLVRGSGVE